MKKRSSFLALLISISLLSNAQQEKVIYKESLQDFPNPERGFYIPIEVSASRFKPLTTAKLMAYKQPVKVRGATYTINTTLVFRYYVLDTFTDKPLPVSFLENIQKDMDALREAGMKMIPRFAYTNTTKTGDCKDGAICPPYGDASTGIVFNHIQQLKPLLQKNADIIAALQMGFIGIWGENYYTDYFGDASANGTGVIADSSWQLRSEVLKALLDALPKDRMIQVRTPQIKQRFVYGPKALVTSAPLKEPASFDQSDVSRIGFHNDCFLSGPDDYGTYYDYGNSSSSRKPANEELRNYTEADSRYVAVGGETCDDVFSPQNDCAPAGHAEEEMKALHFSFLNAAYNNKVNNDWDSLGCMESIKQKLGYRFVLVSGSYPSHVKKDKKLHIEIELHNIGYASPFNPRSAQLVLRNTKTMKVYTLNFLGNIQKWFPGKINLEQTFVLPSEISAGSY
ncbi:MAG: DUF4832 domain-containing protein, partial [Ginsengibacter sp.]